MSYIHKPVMLNEVIEYLNPQPGDSFIDCTLGGCGYTFEIAKRVGEKGRVVSIDLDKQAIMNAEKVIRENKLENVTLVNDNFKNLQNIIKDVFQDTRKFRGIVLDLGLSENQIRDNSKGITFQEGHPINMSFGDNDGKTEEILNSYNQKDLEDIIKNYGEERFARRISERIVEKRKIEKIIDTKQLSDIVLESIPRRFQNKNIHPATKTFQAFRIATNDELDNLEKVLPQIVDLLDNGGRVAIVSFHSLEDRIVKKFFKEQSLDCICPSEIPVCRCDHKASLKLITRKVIKSSDEEIKNNSKSRSAKLRVAERIKS